MNINEIGNEEANSYFQCVMYVIYVA